MSPTNRSIILKLAAVMVVVGIAAVIGAWWWRYVEPKSGHPEVAILHDSGSPHALNIVILGDGFTSKPDSIGGYRTAAEQYTARLKEVAPFKVMPDAFNVYRVDVISEEPGIDVPATCNGFDYANPPDDSLEPWARSPADRNTALHTTWCPPNWPNYRFIDSTDMAVVWDYANTAGVFPDLVVVLVNDWAAGAAAWANAFAGHQSGGVTFVSIRKNLTKEKNAITGVEIVPQEPAMYPDVAIHETAHLGPFLLRDEYGHGTGAVDPADQLLIDGSPNLMTGLALPLKWSLLQTPGSAVPTDCDTPPLPDAAAAPGGGGYASGVYHARCNCKMKEFTHETFCVVCRQRILDTLAWGNGLPPGATFRVILDSFRLKTLNAGEYSLEFSASEGPTTVPGTWPKSGSVNVMSDRTEEPGYSILDLPLSANPGASVELTYRIFGRDNDGTKLLLESRSISISMPAAGTGSVQQFDFDSHRVTFGVARK